MKSTQGILRMVVTGNIECLSTGSQQGYLWLGLSSFINLLDQELFFLILAHPVYKM